MGRGASWEWEGAIVPFGKVRQEEKWPSQCMNQPNGALETSQALPPTGRKDQGFALCRSGGWGR